MSVKLLTEHHLEFLSLKGAVEARMSLHMSKCHIVGNHMSRLIISKASKGAIMKYSFMGKSTYRGHLFQPPDKTRGFHNSVGR